MQFFVFILFYLLSKVAAVIQAVTIKASGDIFEPMDFFPHTLWVVNLMHQPFFSFFF